MSCLMLDLVGYELTSEECEVIQHPTVGGVILFSRNYDNPEQLLQLTRQIRHAANVVDKPLLLAVDHEGGRVQRFRQGFSRIPAMGSLFGCANEDLVVAQSYAKACGFLMASEVLAMDIDISFAPVLDIGGISKAIGDRGFHQDVDVIVALASYFIVGMNQAGMVATGKHFPGHGHVVADTHEEIAVDARSKAEIEAQDIAVFAQLMQQNLLAAVMPAHVIYPAFDKEFPAGFSPFWLGQYLRQTLGFNGVIFSDDLSMEGASAVGGYAERAKHALNAGCDMVLACNNPVGAIEVIDGLKIEQGEALAHRQGKLMALKGRGQMSWHKRQLDTDWLQTAKIVEKIVNLNQQHNN